MKHTTNEAEPLSAAERKQLRNGTARMLKCAVCGKETFYGQMNLLSLAIQGHKPVCSAECNRDLGQLV